MFTERFTTRRTVTVAVALATATGLAWGGAGSAVADPPALDVDPCAQELAKAAEWPGTDSDGSRSFSDAYDSYLGRRPACVPST